jgi:hypothetical protein
VSANAEAGESERVKIRAGGKARPGRPRTLVPKANGFLSPNGIVRGYCPPTRGQYASDQPLSSNPMGADFWAMTYLTPRAKRGGFFVLPSRRTAHMRSVAFRSASRSCGYRAASSDRSLHAKARARRGNAPAPPSRPQQSSAAARRGLALGSKRQRRADGRIPARARQNLPSPRARDPFPVRVAPEGSRRRPCLRPRTACRRIQRFVLRRLLAPGRCQRILFARPSSDVATRSSPLSVVCWAVKPAISPGVVLPCLEQVAAVRR